MRVYSFLSSSFMMLLMLLAGCDNDHGNYSFVYNGTTYEVVKDKKTWPEAAAYAAKRNAKLAEIKHKASNSLYKSPCRGCLCSGNVYICGRRGRRSVPVDRSYRQE